MQLLRGWQVFTATLFTLGLALFMTGSALWRQELAENRMGWGIPFEVAGVVLICLAYFITMKIARRRKGRDD